MHGATSANSLGTAHPFQVPDTPTQGGGSKQKTRHGHYLQKLQWGSPDKPRPCSEYREINHWKKDCPNRRCKWCDKRGHLANECPLPPFNQFPISSRCHLYLSRENLRAQLSQ